MSGLEIKVNELKLDVAELRALGDRYRVKQTIRIGLDPIFVCSNTATLLPADNGGSCNLLTDRTYSAQRARVRDIVSVAARKLETDLVELNRQLKEEAQARQQEAGR